MLVALRPPLLIGFNPIHPRPGSRPTPDTRLDKLFYIIYVKFSNELNNLSIKLNSAAFAQSEACLPLVQQVRARYPVRSNILL